MITKKTIRQLRSKRVARIRAVVIGSSERPRICVYRSHMMVYGQCINDETGKTMTTHRVKGKNVEAGKTLGIELAKKITALGVTKAVFDRSGYKYHGVVKAIAEALREGGITI